MKQTATARNRNSDTPAALAVEVQNVSSTPGAPGNDEIHDWLAYVIDTVGGFDGQRVEIAVRIVDEAEGRTLNRKFRQVDLPTNVLAFPAGDATDHPGLPPQAAPALGDLVLCGAIVAREAETQRKATADHWAHLLVHGMLHLLGYDHQSPAEAAVMEDLETELLQGRGIDDPYCGR